MVVFTERDQCSCSGDDRCFGESFRQAYLVHGSAATTTIDLADVGLGMGGFMLAYDQPMEYCGASEVAYFAGDVDNDGMQDFLIDLGFVGALIRGTTETAPISLSDPGPAGYMVQARTLSAAGDFNGDGLGDIAIQDTRNFMWHVAFGRAGTDTVPTSDLMAGIGGFSVAPPDLYQFALGHVGDVNGDGIADLALTDRSVAGGDGSEWRSYIMYGGPDVGAPVLCDLALGIGGFGIAGTAERPVVYAYGSGMRRPDATDVIVSSNGGVYVVSAPL